jgi:hypothetical protein
MASTGSTDNRVTAQDAAYWYVPVIRAVPAAALASAVTFAGGRYTPEFGLIVFGAFAVVAGLVGIILSLRGIPRGVDRTVFLLQAIVSVLAGVGALVGVRAGLPLFLAIVSGWGVVTGALEVYVGFRSRGKRATSRDWIFIGALTVLLGIVALVIPPDYMQHYVDPAGPRILNTAVMIVGSLGVYGAIAAVYLVIAGLSLKWSATSPAKNGATT